MACPSCGATNVHSWVFYIDSDQPSVCNVCAAKTKRAQVSKFEILRREKIPLRVGMTTLVCHIGFAEVIGPCPKCSHDHVADPRWSGHQNGREAICMVGADQNSTWPPFGGCGARLPVKDQYPMRHGNCCSLTWPVNKAKRPDGSTDYQSTGPSYPCRNMNSENVAEAAKRWPELVDGVEIEVLDDGSCRVVDERLPAAWRKHFCSGCGYFEDDEAWARYMQPRPPQDDEPRKLNVTWSQEMGTGFIYAPYVPPP